MALFTCNMFSVSLKTYVTFHVILPGCYKGDPIKADLQEYYAANSGPFRTLYLLHGGVADASCWLRYTSVERYADENNMAVVMPSVGNSYYTDMVHGGKYYTFVAKELPLMARSCFPLSDKREDNYLAGLSMGGYGALKIALNNPDDFSACASISGVVDVMDLLTCGLWEDLLDLDDIYGSDRQAVAGGINDIYALTQRLHDTRAARLIKSRVNVPRIYLAVGTEDYFCKTNTEYHEFLDKLGIEHTFEPEPGNHDWLFWDPHLEHAMRFLAER